MWVVANPLQDKSGPSVAMAITNMVHTHGPPLKIITDHGREFVNEHLVTSAYHPQTNGQAERTNRTLKTALAKYCNESHDDWDIFFPVNTGVRQGCVLAPSLFNACMDWVLDKVVDQSDCGASIGNTKITDLVFADDAVIFAESLEVLVMALKALHEEAKPLGLEVSWLKTKVQVFGDLLDEAVQSVHACGEDIEI
ncbi:Gypsy retrotransposon integrase-like protein 1 [Chionoecetes opilio]|uniref:Gypsy retrotransposon integrase-like protein 1 n=1 Tax=Chionoecetes opilio TaxID=41210 RepID=A0A8J5D652_CHIOP|nr:Gypsy retrotransposon integrase-like protein 1 [Chionoecetes opilio]